MVRPRAAQQLKAAQHTGTSASQGGGTGSPSPSKRGPPRNRQSPATDETRSPSQKKKKATKAHTADFATVTPILQSETAEVMESATENNDESPSSSVAKNLKRVKMERVTKNLSQKTMTCHCHLVWQKSLKRVKMTRVTKM